MKKSIIKCKFLEIIHDYNQIKKDDVNLFITLNFIYVVSLDLYGAIFFVCINSRESV